MGLGANWLWLVFAGVAVGVLGLLAFTGRLSRFGRLPGDVRYSGKSTRVYFPLTSMLLISIFLSLLLTLLSWLFG